MNTPIKRNFTRRETLIQTLKGFVLALFASPVIAQGESSEPSATSEPKFSPENDYPFFGWSPEDSPSETNG